MTFCQAICLIDITGRVYLTPGHLQALTLGGHFGTWGHVSVECCLFVLDYSGHIIVIIDIVADMRMAVKKPEHVVNFWVDWMSTVGEDCCV